MTVDQARAIERDLTTTLLTAALRAVLARCTEETTDAH